MLALMGVSACPDRISRSIDLVTEMELCLPSEGLTQLCIYTGDETPDKGPHILPRINTTCVRVCVRSVGRKEEEPAGSIWRKDA